MVVLVTGANGFIGKNLCATLKTLKIDYIPYDKDTTKTLEECVDACDFVIHLAGVNRPLSNTEFYDGNVNLTVALVNCLKKQKRKIPLLLSSSIQASLDNDYGKSKKQAENHVFAYGQETGSDVFVFRLENAFGKWCRPNYNSVVATFCHKIANNEEIIIHDPSVKINFVYIDDIVAAFINCLESAGSDSILYVKPSYTKTIQELADLLYSFKESRQTLLIPDQKDGFIKKLYATYLSYLRPDDFSYDLIMYKDDRGSFTEFIKTQHSGQVSINISKPHITKGNHWHHTKNEKFLVVKGKGAIRFRDIWTNEIITYEVSDQKLEVVDIPVGYTHQIVNLGDDDMVTVMWVNETFDPNNPDTIYEDVMLKGIKHD